METEEKDDEEEEEQPSCEGWGSPTDLRGTALNMLNEKRGSPTDLCFHHIKKEKEYRMRKGQPD